MLPPSSAFNLHVRASVRSYVHCVIRSARHRCLLKLICDPSASCFWHMAPYSKEARALLWVWQTSEDGFFSSCSLVPSPSVIQYVKQGRMENANGNPALIAWRVLQNTPTHDCDWPTMIQLVFSRALNPPLLIHWFVLCYCRLCYKYRFFCSGALPAIVFKNNIFTWKMQFWGAGFQKSS